MAHTPLSSNSRPLTTPPSSTASSRSQSLPLPTTTQSLPRYPDPILNMDSDSGFSLSPTRSHSPEGPFSAPAPPDPNEKRYNNLSVLRRIPLNTAEAPTLRLLMHYLALMIALPLEERPKQAGYVPTSSPSSSEEGSVDVGEEDEDDDMGMGVEEVEGGSEGSEYMPNSPRGKKGKKKEKKEKKSSKKKKLPKPLSATSPSLLTSHLRFLPATHNAAIERIMSAVHLNGTTYTLLRDAVKKFVGAREGTDEDVLAAVKELEEVGEENVLCRPWANIPAYREAVEKFYGVEGEEDDEMAVEERDGEDVRMKDVEGGQASRSGSRLERAKLESLARGASATPSAASSGTEKVKRRRRRNPHGIKKGEGRACIPCRERHVTCDRGRPVCGTCAKHKRECVKHPEKDSKKKGRGKGEKEEEKDREDCSATTPTALPAASAWATVN
ncbi:hypothetical protein B0J14DRAFT_560150 [Halenospora varia]|nr:hypothetical protein B0J14DRAFT_560150 [Halenospora varia]